MELAENYVNKTMWTYVQMNTMNKWTIWTYDMIELLLQRSSDIETNEILTTFYLAARI